MERLTDRVGENGRTVIYVGKYKQYEGGDIPCEISDAAKREVLKRLAAYEDAEEQGRLLVLPCKMGDKIYQTDGIRVCESTVRQLIFDTENIAFDVRAIGKTVFLTLEKAEAKMDRGAVDDNL